MVRSVLPLLVLLIQQSFAQTGREAEQARAAGRVQDAVRLYAEGVRAKPSWVEGWWSLGTLLYDQDRFPEAEAALTRFIALKPEGGPALALLGLCEYETRNYERSMAHLQAWAGHGSPGTKELSAVANIRGALLLTRERRFEQALDLLRREARAGNNSSVLVEGLGLASLRMPNLPEDYAPGRRELVWLAGRSALQAALGNFERAERESKRLLLHYRTGAGRALLSRLHPARNEQRRSARAQFEEELRISPGHAPAMLQLAIRELGQQKPAKAASLAKRAAAIEPASALAHRVLGQALLELKRFPESVRSLESARKLAPEDPRVLIALAKAYAALGRDRDANREQEALSRIKQAERRALQGDAK